MFTEQNADDASIIIVDDQGTANDGIFDISDRIFELRDQTSIDLISKNINDAFSENSVIEGTNYVTRFKERYDMLKGQSKYDGDIDILNNSLQELCEIVSANLSVKRHVAPGKSIDDDAITDLDSYLADIETLYEFFVVRRYTNVRDYFKSRFIKGKVDFVERYKDALDGKDGDVFLAQDKKKYKDISDAIVIHFANDIISDIRSEIAGGYDFFKNIVDLDLYEEFNSRMSDMLINYGSSFAVVDDAKAAEDYLSFLDDDEVAVTLRNDILTAILQEADINR